MSVEAVYWQHQRLYVFTADSIEDARAQLVDGEERGSLASVGVFEDGKPVLTDVWVEPREPDETEAAKMAEVYVQAKEEA